MLTELLHGMLLLEPERRSSAAKALRALEALPGFAAQEPRI